MKSKYLFVAVCFFLALSFGWTYKPGNWRVKKETAYHLYYTEPDAGNIIEYQDFVNKGIISVKSFFCNATFNKFKVLVHPDRNSLDTTWQNEFNMPGFKSECWMVASGVAERLDIISPKKWDSLACEHRYSNSRQTQNLITHELIHVYHAQVNTSSDFSNVEGIDWFVEGLATYASGQCDSSRIGQVKNAIEENKTPGTLDNFWTGKLKYGFSGSLVMFIDHKFGRAKLKELLFFTKKTQILSALNFSESKLINEWKKYIAAL